MNPIDKIIFIVEDNEIFAKSLKTFLQTRFSNVKEVKIFRIGEMCLMEMDRNPDVIIMDYILNAKYDKAENGLEIIKRIKVVNPKSKIIVLSSQNDFNVIVETVKQYDCLYVQKDLDAFKNVEQHMKDVLKQSDPLAF